MNSFFFYTFTLVLLFLPLSSSTAQNKAAAGADFIQALISGTEDLSAYVDRNDLQKSARLQIKYTSVRNKFLISFDIDPVIKDQLHRGLYTYNLKNEDLGNNFSRVVLSVNEVNYEKAFYFREGKLIDPATYFTRNWESHSTRYFHFLISDPALFNKYSSQQLENFTDAMIKLLRLTDQERENLEKNKIIYILCKDRAEIQSVTGFDTRGIYILAYDEIITTFNCHFHELAHLLINLKLKNLPLYTLPLFQEGFAAATGGRGGVSRDVILDIGRFLQKTGFLQLNAILTRDDFQKEDASMTYPVAALYNFFLMNEYGILPYLELYLNYSGEDRLVSSLKASEIKLPPNEKFISFIKNYRARSGVSAAGSTKGSSVIFEGKNAMVYLSGENYIFRLRKDLLMGESSPLADYKSRKFNELFSAQQYKGEKYLITADSMDVNVYNLYTNNVIASYAAGYTEDHKKVPAQEGYFTFTINKSVFDEELKTLLFREL